MAIESEPPQDALTPTMTASSPSLLPPDAPTPPIRVINLETQINEEESHRHRAASKYGGVYFHLGFAMLVCMILVLLFWSASLQDKDMDLKGAKAAENIARLRQVYVEMERRRRLGQRMQLGPLEEVANARLLAVKQVDEEMHHLWRSYHNRPPSFLNHHNVSETDLYALLKSMPKGGLLHVHDSGMLRTDILIDMTQSENLWVCVNLHEGFEDFRFSQVYPHIPPSDDYQCTWMLMRNFYGFEQRYEYVERLREALSVPQEGFESAEKLARHLKRAQRLIHGLVTYKPLWSNFLFAMLQDLYDDGVHYVEMRSSLPIVSGDFMGTSFYILKSFLRA